MKKLLILTAAAIVLMTFAGTSAFADQRDPERTWRDGDRGYAAEYGYGYGDQDRDYRDYRDRDVRGIVERVNYRLGYLILRERDGDFVKVDMRPVRRYHREPDLDDLRRGDAIVVSGDWSRDGLFRAERVDRIRRAW